MSTQNENGAMVTSESTRRVCVWREELLPGSETFILNQIRALCRWKPVLSGVRACAHGLPVTPDFTLEGDRGLADRLDHSVYWRAGSSVRLHRHLKSTSLVHAHFGPDGAHVTRAARLARRPLIVTFHGYDATIPAVTLGVDYSRLFRQAVRLVAVSQSIGRRLVEAGAPEAKIAVIPLGIPLTSGYAPRKPGRHILFVGRLVPKKGCTDLLQALAGIDGAPPLLVIGDGPLRGDLERLAESLRVDATFVGARGSEYVARAMAASIAVCLPSQTAPDGDQEGLPIVVLEAGAAGVPVVSYVSAGIPEAVVHGETGLLALEGDIAGLADNLATVIRDLDLSARLGAAARRRVHKYFDITARTAELERLYDQVAEEGRLHTEVPSSAGVPLRESGTSTQRRPGARMNGKLSVLRRLRPRRREAPFNTGKQHYETWQTRAQDAVSLWVDARGSWEPDRGRLVRIADYGAGNERLGDLLGARLSEQFEYFPFDLHPQQRTTVKLNVLEESPAESFDLIFALGLLEYLPPGNSFIDRVRDRTRFVLVSFTYAGSTFGGGLAKRESLGWQAHDDREGLERKFTEAGFSLVDFRTTQHDEAGLWLWESVQGKRNQ